MKTKMIIPYRNGFWVALGCLLVNAFLWPLIVLLLRRGEAYGCAVLCAFFALFFVAKAWMRLNYGMRINEKRVVLRARGKRKVVPYDSVREIVIAFTHETVSVRIRLQSDEEMRFVWEEMVMDSKAMMPARGWGSNSVPVRVDIRMTDRFVAKSIENLSCCEKVRIENLYSLDL